MKGIFLKATIDKLYRITGF